MIYKQTHCYKNMNQLLTTDEIPIHNTDPALYHTQLYICQRFVSMILLLRMRGDKLNMQVPKCVFICLQMAHMSSHMMTSGDILPLYVNTIQIQASMKKSSKQWAFVTSWNETFFQFLRSTLFVITSILFYIFYRLCLTQNIYTFLNILHS